MRRFMVFVVSVVLASSTMPVGVASGQWPGANGRVAFVDQRGALTLVNPDGTERSVVDVQPPDCGRLVGLANPAWSPVGDRIAVDGVGVIDIVTRSCIGVGQPNGEHPSWSPDGAALAIEYPTTGIGVACVPPATCAGRLLIASDCYVWGVTPQPPRYDGLCVSWPAWSPNGDLIAFAGLRLDPGNTGGYFRSVWTIRPDGSDRRLVKEWPSADSGGGVSRLDWLPDGRTITYAYISWGGSLKLDGSGGAWSSPGQWGRPGPDGVSSVHLGNVSPSRAVLVSTPTGVVQLSAVGSNFDGWSWQRITAPPWQVPEASAPVLLGLAAILGFVAAWMRHWRQGVGTRLRRV